MRHNWTVLNSHIKTINFLFLSKIWVEFKNKPQGLILEIPWKIPTNQSFYKMSTNFAMKWVQNCQHIPIIILRGTQNLSLKR